MLILHSFNPLKILFKPVSIFNKFSYMDKDMSWCANFCTGFNYEMLFAEKVCCCLKVWRGSIKDKISTEKLQNSLSNRCLFSFGHPATINNPEIVSHHHHILNWLVGWILHLDQIWFRSWILQHTDLMPHLYLRICLSRPILGN